MSTTVPSAPIYAIQPRTIIGPLTTTFTPPAACTTGILDCPYCIALYYAAECVGVGDGGNNINNAKTCWPAPSQGAPSPSPTQFNGWGFYSPGLVCPTGYTSACTATAGGHSDWNVQFSMTSGETAVGCCPSGFACGYLSDVSHQYCSGTAARGDRVPVSECFWRRDGFASLPLPATFISSAPSAQPTNLYTVNGYDLVAAMIEIVWHSSDREVSSTPITSGAHPTITPVTSSSVSAAETGSKKTGDGGLSLGAKVGIGVAVPLVVIAMVAGIVVFMRRSKKHHSRQFEAQPDSNWMSPQASVYGPSTHFHREPEFVNKPRGIQTGPVYEADGNRPYYR